MVLGYTATLRCGDCDGNLLALEAVVRHLASKVQHAGRARGVLVHVSVADAVRVDATRKPSVRCACAAKAGAFGKLLWRVGAPLHPVRARLP